MQLLSLIWGILSILVMLIAFFPCLGWLNGLVIPFAGIGIIVSGIAVSQPGPSNRSAVAGLILCVVTIFFALIRWVIGGFIF